MRSRLAAGRGALLGWAARGTLAAATLVLASLATAMLLRKPAPVAVFTPIAAPIAAPVAAAEASPLRDLLPITPRVAAPEITFHDADDRVHSLREFRGKAVLLNVWATWCGPCVEELPSLAELAPRAARLGVVVVPVSVDRGGVARVRAFYASHGVDGLPAWNDAESRATEALGLRGVPTSFLIDAQGREVAKLEGAADWDAPGVAEILAKMAR